MKSLSILFLFTLGTPVLHAAVDPIPAIGVPADGAWGLAAVQAQTLFRQHKLAEAAESAKRALRIAKHDGDSNSHLAASYHQLGNIYRDWGHCTAAKANYSHSIAVWEKLPGAKPQYVFNSIISLLGTLCECNQFAVAEKTFRAYESKLQSSLSGPLDEVQLVSMRATILRARKNYVQAEAYYRQAISLLEQTPGSNPSQSEEVRVDLAAVLDQQGRHAESLAESEHVIAFLDHSQSPRAATLVASLNNAACSLADLGRKKESELMFERALSAATEVFGPDSRFAAKIMLNYARVLRENKEIPAAEAMQKKGAEAFRRAVIRDNATVDIGDL
jgi:tetratricopeptide (TPR) repeat protein